MDESLPLEVLPPDKPKESSTAHPIDPKLAEEADRILFKGMPTRDKVFKLHVQKGWEIMEIARALGMSYSAIWQHWQTLQAEIEAMPADSGTPGRRALMRARLEEQFKRASRIADTERSVVLCLKTLEVMAKLDGLNIEPQTGGPAPTPYALPEEIAGSVRQKLLELHGRGGNTP